MTLVRVFLPFALGYFLSYLYRTVNAVIAPDLEAALGLDAADLGLVTSAYFLTFAAFQLPLGILLDRWGPRRVEAALLVFAALGAFVFASADSTKGLVLGRALIGFGVSACLMGAFEAYVLWFPPQRLPLVNGLQMAAGGAGALAATAPVEAALHLTDWRGLFHALSVLTVIVAAVVLLSVPRRNEEGPAHPLSEQIAGIRDVFADPVFLGNKHVIEYKLGGRTGPLAELMLHPPDGKPGRVVGDDEAHGGFRRAFLVEVGPDPDITGHAPVGDKHLPPAEPVSPGHLPGPAGKLGGPDEIGVLDVGPRRRLGDREGKEDRFPLFFVFRHHPKVPFVMAQVGGEKEGGDPEGMGPENIRDSAAVGAEFLHQNGDMGHGFSPASVGFGDNESQETVRQGFFHQVPGEVGMVFSDPPIKLQGDRTDVFLAVFPGLDLHFLQLIDEIGVILSDRLQAGKSLFDVLKTVTEGMRFKGFHDSPPVFLSFSIIVSAYQDFLVRARTTKVSKVFASRRNRSIW